jgi:transposase
MSVEKLEEFKGSRRSGRRPALSEEQAKQLVEHVSSNRQATTRELCEWVKETFGVTVSTTGVRNALKRHGIDKRRAPQEQNAAGEGVDTAPEAKKWYGYADHHRMTGAETATGYPSSVTDAEWAMVEHLFTNQGRGRKPSYDRRVLLDAILYVVRGGVSWRMLPKEFPPWQNVYATFRRWSRDGVFVQYYDVLREMMRERAGRPVEPTAGIMDAQSTRTSPQGGVKGYDGGKKVKGRKRHLLVDTLGLLLAVAVTAANVSDRNAMGPLLAVGKTKYPSLNKLYVDSGYSGAKASAAAKELGVDLRLIRRPSQGHGSWSGPELPFTTEMSQPFTVLPKRWVVERNNAWNERPRRMNRDHDRLLSVSEAWIWLLQGHMLHRRLSAGAA